MQMDTVSHLVELLPSTPAYFAALRRILLHCIATDPRFPRFHRTEMISGWQIRKYWIWVDTDDKIQRSPNDLHWTTSLKFQRSRSIGRHRICGI